jgi:hypothetical protein
MSHSKSKFVLFVPYWITRILDREKISYSKLLKLSELRKHLSVEDISALYWLNINHPLFAGLQTESRLAMNDMMLTYIWKANEDIEFVTNKIVPMEQIANDAIRARLWAEIPYPEGQEPFKINTISEMDLVFVVTVYPGGDSTYRASLSGALLKLLYAHTGYDDMARNHLFKGYIERLALANNAL